MTAPVKSLPCTRAGWIKYYQELYNRTGRESAAHMAVWYMILETAGV